MDQLVFGTDGWRDIIADKFTFANVRRVSEALGRVLPEKSTVVVGYDHRFHSEEFAKQAAAILADQKHKIILLTNPTSTPAVSFSVKKHKAKVGVMITASHNPPLFNGFKIKVHPGCSADPEFTQRVQDNIQDEIAEVSLDFKHKEYSPDDDYVNFLISKLDKKIWKSPKASVVVDAMYGPGGHLFQKVMKKLNLKGHVIHAERDPLFGGQAPEPIETHLDELKKTTVAKKAALGLALDGDADRLGAVDEKGTYLTPHHIYPLLLLHLLKNRKQKGKLVQAFSLGYLSERIAKDHKIEVIEVPIGFKYVVQKMLEDKILLGGEESGGYGVGLWAPERDGILSGLLLVELVLAAGKPLSEIRKDMEKQYGKSVFLRQDYPVRSVIENKKEWAENIVKRLPAKIAGGKVRDYKTLDGLKVFLEDDSWLLLRPSGTEPLMRTYAESPDKKVTQQLLEKAQEFAAMRSK